MRLLVCGISAAVLTLSACENGMRDMYDQPKYKPLEPAQLWTDGRASRPSMPNTVPYSAGTLAATSSGRGGRLTASRVAMASYDREALARGRQRFDIYCAPCHGAIGDGDGYITERGFPHPPTYHTERMRSVPDRYLFDVITHGYGVMYPYGDRIPESDRWAIVGYIRALQLAEHASVADVPDGEKSQLGIHE
jgi:mono/diheme cytochrome c family protein